jgi:hypothetical protein
MSIKKTKKKKKKKKRKKAENNMSKMQPQFRQSLSYLDSSRSCGHPFQRGLYYVHVDPPTWRKKKNALLLLSLNDLSFMRESRESKRVYLQFDLIKTFSSWFETLNACMSTNPSTTDGVGGLPYELELSPFQINEIISN